MLTVYKFHFMILIYPVA